MGWLRRLFSGWWRSRAVAPTATARRVVCDWDTVRVVLTVPEGAVPPDDDDIVRMHMRVADWLAGRTRSVVLTGGLRMELYETAADPLRCPYPGHHHTCDCGGAGGDR